MSSTENDTNSTFTPTNTTQEGISWIYTEGVGILMIICTLSMILNTRVLVCVFWIKRPLSATLYISLSLAAADLITSLIVFIHFFLSSYLYKVHGINFPSCIGLIFEAFRLGGIINTVLHLLFLACNHYLGIVRPLHYQSIMTHRKITACLVALWILPPIYILIYFSTYEEDGFQHEDCTNKFLLNFEFRLMFTLLLVVPFILMTFIYSHILLIVRRQQRSWLRAAERGASCRHRGGTSQSESRRRHHQHNLENRRTQQMVRNIKALYTTLLILGSFVAGLLPPIVVFILFCNNCLYKYKNDNESISLVNPISWKNYKIQHLKTPVSQELVNRETEPNITKDQPIEIWHELFWFVNVLLVTKPLANPIIYAARMQEIKEATRRMRVSFCRGDGRCRWCSPALPLLWLCCGWSAYDGDAGSHTAAHLSSQHGRQCGDEASYSQHLYHSGEWRATQLCRFSNGQAPNSKNENMSTVL